MLDGLLAALLNALKGIKNELSDILVRAKARSSVKSVFQPDSQTVETIPLGLKFLLAVSLVVSVTLPGLDRTSAKNTTTLLMKLNKDHVRALKL